MPTYGMLVVLLSNLSCEVYQKECRRKDKESIGFFPYMSVSIKLLKKKKPTASYTIKSKKKGTSRIKQENDLIFQFLFN